MLPSVVCHGRVGRSHKIRRVRCHFGEQMYGGSEREREAGRLVPWGSIEAEVLRNRLVCEACSLSGAMVTFSSGLLLWTITGSVACCSLDLC